MKKRNTCRLTREERPWGRFEVLLKGPGFQVKRIEVHPGLRFSLQKHNRRFEKWIVVCGKGAATLGRRTFRAKAGSIFNIPKGCIHRMHNRGRGPLVLVEVQFGRYLGEDDIVRLADDFGRH